MYSKLPVIHCPSIQNSYAAVKNCEDNFYKGASNTVFQYTNVVLLATTSSAAQLPRSCRCHCSCSDP
jgi:hypothetical protein